jgi:hypothetical protein
MGLLYVHVLLMKHFDFGISLPLMEKKIAVTPWELILGSPNLVH